MINSHKVHAINGIAATLLLFLSASCSLGSKSQISAVSNGSPVAGVSGNTQLCAKEISVFIDDITRSGAKVTRFSILQDPNGPPLQDRRDYLEISLASGQEVGARATQQEIKAGIEMVKNNKMLLAYGNRIISSCPNLSSIVIYLHELSNGAYLHKDYSVRVEECVDVNQQPRWGQRVCT